MLFTLRNLGRLEEATIDLGKDLIVLTGPNNTSKTSVAHAIYIMGYPEERAQLGPEEPPGASGAQHHLRRELAPELLAQSNVTL
jgi:hypothetical protein